MSPPRLVSLALAGGFFLTGCYGTTEPSFHPGDSRDILQTVMLRGIEVTDPVPGETACSDDDLVGNTLYFTARMPGEEEFRDVFVHLYRERSWDASLEEVDGCQAVYEANNPDAVITRMDIPLYRIFGADWSEELTEGLTRALEEAAEAGKDV
ncbi:MAG: hypothetical protein AB1Z67_06935 [Candidatus Limnocylindrales bacterium]